MSQARRTESRSSSAGRVGRDEPGAMTRAPSRTTATPTMSSSSRADTISSSPHSVPRAGLVETLASQLQLAQDRLRRLEQQYDGGDSREASMGTVQPAPPAVTAPAASSRRPLTVSTPAVPESQRATAFFDRAQEVLDDYAATVRHSEDRSQRLLHERLEAMETLWRTRLATFQDAKEAYEAHIADVIQRSLADRDGALKETAQRLTADFDSAARRACEGRASLEKQVLQQAEEFRKQYKAILDEDYAQRCEALEARLAEREKQWSALVQEERRKTLEASLAREQTASTTHLAAVKEALTDVSRLRAELVDAHAAQEQKLLEQFTRAAQESTEAHQAALRDCTARAQKVQQECAETLLQMHRKVESLQAQLTAKEAGTVRADNAEQVAKTEKLFEHVSQVRREVEAQWRTVVDGLREDYEARHSRLTQQYEQRVAQLRAEQVEREQSALATFDERVKAVEDAAEKRWSVRLSDAQRASERQHKLVQSLRAANEELTAKLDAAVQSLEAQDVAHQTALITLKQNQDEAWQAKLSQVRERYDALLQSALQEQQGAVSQAVHEQTLERLQAMEARAVHAQEDLAQQVREAVSQTESLWRQRLRESDQRASTYEVQLQARYSALRQQLYQTVSAHEGAISAKAEEDRKRLEDECDARCQLERERLEARHEAALATLKATYESRVAARQEAARQEEALLQAREEALTERECQLEEAVRVRVQELLQAASASLQTELDARWEALRDAEMDMEVRRGLLRHEMVAEFEGRLTAAHTRWEEAQESMMSAWLQHQDEQQTLWAESRTDENSLLHAFYRKALLDQQAAHQRWSQQVVASAQDLVTALESRTSEHDAQLRSAWATFQAELVAQTEAKGQSITQAHTEQMKALAAESADDACARWQTLHENLLQHSRDEAMQNARLEAVLKAKYDLLLQEERQRGEEAVDAAKRSAKEALREAQQAWQRELTTQADERKTEAEALRQQWETQQREHEENHAKQLAELRSRYEALLAHQRQQNETREDELARSFDRLQRQAVDSAQRQTQQLRESYEKKLQAMAEHEVQQRADHARALAEAEAAAVRKHENLTRDLERQYAQSLADLEAALTRKTQELASAEAGEQRRVAEHVMALEATMEAQYTAFVESERQLREAEEASVEARTAKQVADAVEAAKREAASTMQAAVAAERARCAELEAALAEARQHAERKEPLEPSHAPLQPLSPNVWSSSVSATGTRTKPLLTVVRPPPPGTSYALSAFTAPPQGVHGGGAGSTAPGPRTESVAAGVSAAQWQRLRQLWQVCGVPEEDVEAFMARLQQLPMAHAQASEVDEELRRLELRLPLMELVAQREVLREALCEARGPGQDNEARRREKEEELRQLTQTLLKELPAFERRHGQLFKFRGERLVDAILADDAF